MKLHIAKYEPGRLGGGWTFARTLAEGLGDQLGSYDESEIYFIPSPSMVERAEVDQAKADGKKIVLRLDNIVRNSRNRNTGMSRMKDFAEKADVVIYQSQFARDLLIPFLKVDGVVILNACDQTVFNPNGRFDTMRTRYLYSRYNRDETKNWEIARSVYQQLYNFNPYRDLVIIGQFSDELREYNFDFYMGEDYQYKGVISDQGALAEIYRQTDVLLYSYFNDACSNTLIEALSSGCKIHDCAGMAKTGGAPEILTAFKKRGMEYFHTDRMIQEYKHVIEL